MIVPLLAGAAKTMLEFETLVLPPKSGPPYSMGN